MCVYTCNIYIKPTMLDGPLMSAEYLFTSHCPRALLNTPTASAAADNATARVFIWRICIGTRRRKMYYFNKKIIYIRGKCAGHVFSFIPIVAPSRTYRRIPIFVFFPAGTCACVLYIYIIKIVIIIEYNIIYDVIYCAKIYYITNEIPQLKVRVLLVNGERLTRV